MLNFWDLDMLQRVGKLGSSHAIELNNLDFKIVLLMFRGSSLVFCLFISPSKMFGSYIIRDNFGLNLVKTQSVVTKF